jgi:chemotaxis protein CheX
LGEINFKFYRLKHLSNRTDKFEVKVAMAKKKSVLFLGQPEADLESIRESLLETLGPKTLTILVVAKDGADAAIKSANQKFDAIVIDASAPRLLEGDFLANIKSHQNTLGADLIAIVPSIEFKVPLQLAGAEQVLQKPCDLDILVRALAKTLASAPVMPGGAPGKYHVDVRVVNALLKSTCFICKQFGLDPIKLEKPDSKVLTQPWSGDIAASIAIKSKMFEGALVISFDAAVYLKMFENMLGDPQTEINDDNRDAIGEISNMILGNAKADFTQYEVEMSIPVILEKGKNPESPEGSVSLRIPAQTAAGKFYLEVIAHRLK